MAYDRLAESVRLIEHGLPEAPARLSRRRRSAALAVDVDGDVACTRFVVRGAGHFRQEAHVLVRRGGTWTIVGGGGGGSETDGLADRPSTEQLGRPVVVEGSGSVLDSAGRLLPWGARYVRYAGVLASSAVHAVEVGDRVLAVPRHGRLVVVWATRRPPGRGGVRSRRPGPLRRRAGRPLSQPVQGGATPQPHRGTGAAVTTAAPGWELVSASRVPHST